MKPSDLECAVFATKCLTAALTAFYLSARVGLTKPYWAVTISYFVAQPLAGAVVAKALYLLMGTLLGASAAVILVPNLVNEPILLSVALALWLGVCVYLAVLDRTARSLVFLLAGFTASVIGFPSVSAPGSIFSSSAERVQEIAIGILVGSIVHGALFPRTVTQRLVQRVTAIVANAETWSLSCIAATGESFRSRDQLTTDLDELDRLAINLPFDTARLVPSGRKVRELRDHLSLLLPLASEIENRLIQLRQSAGGLPFPIAALIQRVRLCLGTAQHGLPQAQPLDELERESRGLERLSNGEPIWQEMLILSILSQLSRLIAVHRECRVLAGEIERPQLRGRLSEVICGYQRRRLHSDPGLALRAAAGTASAIILGCAFWIATSWENGAQAILMASICCSIFSNVDTPGRTLFRFLTGYSIGLLLAAIYALAILPRATDYALVAGAIAPPFLLLGSMLARPAIAPLSLGSLIAFPNSLGLGLAYKPDFHGFINAAVAHLLGVAFATAMLALFRTIDTTASVVRVRRACFRDIQRRAAGEFDDTRRWLDGMLDRAALLLARLPSGEARRDVILAHALMSLRVGFVAGELRSLSRRSAAREQILVNTILEGVGKYFRGLDPLHPSQPARSLLVAVDSTVAGFAADWSAERRRSGLILLTSLRGNLFPAAPAYAQGPSAKAR